MAQATELTHDVVKATEVIGVKVENAKGENLGKIHEIILDKLNGRVRYVVLTFGGFLGLGDKLFALPWNTIHYNEDRDCFILDVDQEKLKNAPGFDKNNWPNMSDKALGKTIYSYYGSRPYWEE